MSEHKAHWEDPAVDPRTAYLQHFIATLAAIVTQVVDHLVDIGRVDHLHGRRIRSTLACVVSAEWGLCWGPPDEFEADADEQGTRDAILWWNRNPCVADLVPNVDGMVGGQANKDHELITPLHPDAVERFAVMADPPEDG